MKTEAINHIKFGVMNPEYVKALGVVKLTVPDTYNEDGYPIDGGLLDQRLGVIDPGLICKTCGARAKSCPGHFGRIELVRPAIHSEFGKTLYMILQSTCRNCNKLLLNDESIAKYGGGKPIDPDALVADGEEGATEVKSVMLKRLKDIKRCERCGTQKKKLKFSLPTYFYVDDYKLKPNEIRDMVSKVSNDDLEILGVDAENARPEWLIIDILLVPPVNVRPSITLESGERSEDELTHKLVDIMRINQRLEQNLNAGAPQIIIDDLWELLQYHVTTYFNNETSNIPPARHRSGRALKTLTQRLKGKEGRFRYNLSGKRVNYSARTVISVDPNVDIDEVGVPFAIASKLTVPFYVTEWNIEHAKKMLMSKDYPAVLNVISRDGKRKRVIDTNKEEILKELSPGDMMERQLVDGDIVLFNRQPSLHRMSIMAHRTKVLPGKTFRINLCVAAPYNADFDGDEMNLHVPQTLEARAEAKVLMMAHNQVFSPRDGNVVIGTEQDGITGAYEMTAEDAYVTKEEAAYLLAVSGIYELPEEAKNGKYLARDVFSMLLPRDLSFEFKTKSGKAKIKNGRLIEGRIDNNSIGRGNNALFMKIRNDYGFEELKKFIYSSSKMLDAYVTLMGFTLGVREYVNDDRLVKDRERMLAETFEKVKKLISDYKEGKLESLIGYTQKSSLERMIIAELNLVRDRAGADVLKTKTEKNTAMDMVSSGARGNILNVVQMMMFLGQQATITGGRINRGYATRRALPHIEPGDLSPKGRGFVTTSFYGGLDPIDLFMHAVGSRGSEIYKALLTARSGYLYRRLSNALQDYYVDVDYSVRDAANNLIETQYGGDLVDPMYTKVKNIE